MQLCKHVMWAVATILWPWRKSQENHRKVEQEPDIVELQNWLTLKTPNSRLFHKWNQSYCLSNLKWGVLTCSLSLARCILTHKFLGHPNMQILDWDHRPIFYLSLLLGGRWSASRLDPIDPCLLVFAACTSFPQHWNRAGHCDQWSIVDVMVYDFWYWVIQILQLLSWPLGLLTLQEARCHVVKTLRHLCGEAHVENWGPSPIANTNLSGMWVKQVLQLWSSLQIMAVMADLSLLYEKPWAKTAGQTILDFLTNRNYERWQIFLFVWSH